LKEGGFGMIVGVLKDVLAIEWRSLLMYTLLIAEMKKMMQYYTKSFSVSKHSQQQM
jgi:hypothetical protein